MSEKIFLCYQLSHQDEIAQRDEVSRKGVMEVASIREADGFIRDWLSKTCGADCYQEAQEEQALREENNGALPEMAFRCPEVNVPADLEQYNGFYSYGSMGTFHIFLMVIYDEGSARKFRGDAIREYELNKTLSEAADEMVDMLDRFVASFQEPVDIGEALYRINQLIQNDGLPLF